MLIFSPPRRDNGEPLAGFPATTALLGGTSLVTILLPALHDRVLTNVCIGKNRGPGADGCARFYNSSFLTFQSAPVCRSPSAVVARGYLSLINMTPCPMKTLSSMTTPSQIKV